MRRLRPLTAPRGGLLSALAAALLLSLLGVPPAHATDAPPVHATDAPRTHAPDAPRAQAADAALARAADTPSACALRGTTGWTDEGHDTDSSVFQSSRGTIDVGMIFVDFPDAPATESPATDAAQITPGAEWLWNASYGKTWLAISQHRQWVRMPRAKP